MLAVRVVSSLGASLRGTGEKNWRRKEGFQGARLVEDAEDEKQDEEEKSDGGQDAKSITGTLALALTGVAILRAGEEGERTKGNCEGERERQK